MATLTAGPTVTELKAPEASEPHEVVYSPEMTDSELKKLLGEIGHKIIEAVNRRSPDHVPVVAPSNRMTWQQWLVVAVSVLAIVGGILAGLNYVVSSAITSALVQPGKDLTTITEQGKGLRRDVDRLLDKQARDVLQSPPPLASKGAVEEIRTAADWANQRRVEINAGFIQDLHSKLSPLVNQNDPQAWAATLALASYQSSFAHVPMNENQPSMPLTKIQVTHYAHATPPGDNDPKMTASNLLVPRDQGAMIAPFGVDMNPDQATTNAFVMFEGGGILLDGLRYKNVVMKDVHVVYHGGPVQLEYVTFINCKFSIDNTKAGRELIAKSLIASPVAFDTSN
jgi:hypothetical protein